MTPIFRHLAWTICLGLSVNAQAQAPAFTTSTLRTPSSHKNNQTGLRIIAPMAAATAARQGAQIQQRVLHMYVGQVRVIDTPPVARVAVGNGKMVGVTTLKRQIVLIAQTPGVSDIYVWDRNGTQTNIHLVIDPGDIAQVQTEVQGILQGFPGVTSELRGGQVVLSGALTPERFKALKKAIKTYPGVVNLVQGNAVHMRRMVELDVQVVNFNKSALKNLGINWQQSIVGPSGGLIGDFATNHLYRLGDLGGSGAAGNAFNSTSGTLSGLPLSVSPFSSYLGIVTSITSAINIAVTKGQAYILANPRLVTRSGQDASFLAGGEVPIPVSTGLGQTSVEYKNYGVKLHISPQVDAQGHILATIKTTLSQIDPNVTINGYPGFLTRKTDAVVNVLPGQTIVLSGLINSTGSNNINKVPGLGDMPVLGALFRSTDFQRKQSELVIFVTPHIISPESPRNIALVKQARGYEKRFDNDFRSGYFIPGVGHDIDAVPYPHFPDQPATDPQQVDRDSAANHGKTASAVMHNPAAPTDSPARPAP